MTFKRYIIKENKQLVGRDYWYISMTKINSDKSNISVFKSKINFTRGPIPEEFKKHGEAFYGPFNSEIEAWKKIGEELRKRGFKFKVN
jgi:hypothetical protein